MATTAKAKQQEQGLREKTKVRVLREKITARRAEREERQKQKYAKMRLVATKAPEKLEKCLASLANKCASMAEGWENLRENLGLVKAPREAALKLRIAAKRTYAKNFKRIAEESPDKLAEALSEAYQGLNDIAADIEMAAEQMGVDLESAAVPAAAGGEVGFGSEFEATHDIIEEADEDNQSPEQEHIEEHEEDLTDEDKEASGSDAWVTDREPVTANSGADGFITDRDAKGMPESPTKLGARRQAAQSVLTR